MRKRKTETKSISKDLPIWYPPNEIYYHPVQIESFILPNIFDLRTGDYPTEPSMYRKFDTRLYFWHIIEKSPYIGASRSGLNKHAYYENASIIAGDIDSRINRINTTITLNGHVVPISGALLYDAYIYHKELDYDLLIEASRMLEYISGWRNKSISYDSWRNG